MIIGLYHDGHSHDSHSHDGHKARWPHTTIMTATAMKT